jgi:hypothetical protein
MRGKLTKKIRSIYLENVYVRLARYAKFRFEQAAQQFTVEQELCLREAAHQAARLGAPPVEYVAAQFSVFDAATERAGRLLLPKPCHLRGPGAEQRWASRESRPRIQTCADAIAKAKRSTPGSEGDIFDPERQQKEFFRESRKLENLARATRLPEAEIFRRFASEFSSAFVASRAA